MTRFVGLLLFVSLAACSNSTGPNRLAYEGKSNVSPTPPNTVETTVTVRNTGDDVAEVQGNTCGIPIRAYTTPQRDQAPVWSSNVPAACTAESRIIRIAPGDSYDFHFSGTLPSTLPSGTYYLAVDLRYRLVPAGQFQK
jgi:hypothetical protein